MQSLVQQLFDGPIDIVGDVHGEIDALRELLRHLDYDESGRHRKNRRLVFLGDLTDRGPDSPAVVNLIRSMVEAGRAQCVLGNHDLNILLGRQKYDNDWFFGREFRLDGVLVPQVLADDSVREIVTSFFRTLPLALQRQDLQVVHACWKPEMIEEVRAGTSTAEFYGEFATRIDTELASRPDLDDVDRSLARQNRNPVKVLTSGLEEKVAVPFQAAGKLRHEDRIEWWAGYDRPEFCVFGHYAIPFGDQRGAGRAICVDYGVAYRWKERRKLSGAFRTKLAALRFPEKVLVFDDGASEPWLTC